jgi:coenzyme Q-binding protein COQ10
VPKIEQSVIIDAPIEHVYQIARDVETFPQFMQDLRSLTLVERSLDGSRTVTEWVGLIREFKMTIKWTQEDQWDEATHRDVFTMLSGDMDSMSGVWQFTTEAQHRRASTRPSSTSTTSLSSGRWSRTSSRRR